MRKFVSIEACDLNNTREIKKKCATDLEGLQDCIGVLGKQAGKTESMIRKG